jgi:predicted nucleotidyltransferase
MEISEKQKQKIEELAKKYQLKLILLFGSRATGKVHKESDFDVAYLPSGNLSYDEETDINLQFIGIFSHDRIDTVDLRKAPPLLLFGIFKNCQILFAEDDLIFYRYRAYILKKYIEAESYYEQKYKKLKEKILKL